MWGFCGLIITFLLLITSNFLAIKILGKWWKSIQRLSYLLLILSSSHVLLLEKEVKPWEFIDSFFPVFLVFICWVLARKGVRLKIFPGKL
jgi:DMSO/TMAO reductase YedYZ heme-binding membrane subunit